MKLSELLMRLGVVNSTLKPGLDKDTEVILMAEESDGYGIRDVIHFKATADAGPQMWLVFDEEEIWLQEEKEEEGEEEQGPPDDAPLCEREGDMCALPEVSGEPKCMNPFCVDGVVPSMGNRPCLRCSTLPLQEEKPKVDVCEVSKHRAKRA